MLYIDDDLVRRHLDLCLAREITYDAFVSHARGEANILARAHAGDSRRSINAGGAMLFGQGVLGVKASPQIGSHRSDCINLFDAATGRLEAVIEGGRIGEMRAAALAAIAARELGSTPPHSLGIFSGSGRLNECLASVLQAVPFMEFLVADGPEAAQLVAALRSELRLPARAVPAAQAGLCDVVLAFQGGPQVRGEWVGAGTLVVAVDHDDASGPAVDDALVARAARLVLDWRPEGMAEAEELRGLAPERLASLEIVDLGAALLDAQRGARHGGKRITLFRPAGVSLPDIALASYVATQAERQREAANSARLGQGSHDLPAR